MPDVIGTLFHKDIPYGGVKGDKGNTGATPNISATASVNSSTGTPSVNVVKTGTAENPSFEFAFSNLKGEKGDPGSGSSVSWGEINGDIANQTDLSTELAKKYDENDTAETDIQDTDYFPFYDTSATAKKKSLWSNIKDKLSTLFTLLSIVGTVENGTTASKPYDIGQHFIKDGYFCTAIAAIVQGATLTLNTNYTQGDVAEAMEEQPSKKIKVFDGSSYSEGKRLVKETISTTTNNLGNASIMHISNKEMIQCICTSDGNVYIYPGLNGARNSYIFQAVDKNGNAVANTDLTITVYYYETV